MIKINYESVIVIWGMVLTFNLIMAINHSTNFQWFMVGVSVGALIMLFLSIPHIILLERTLKKTFIINRRLIKECKSLLKKKKK